jgi:hypothetical protein
MVLLLALVLLQDAPRDRTPAEHKRSETRATQSKPHRSTAAHNAFRKSHPCPATGNTVGACHGYVVDHVIALACGGRDDPSNMQWQTVADAKQKDKWERNCEGSPN